MDNSNRSYKILPDAKFVNKLQRSLSKLTVHILTAISVSVFIFSPILIVLSVMLILIHYNSLSITNDLSLFILFI